MNNSSDLYQRSVDHEAFQTPRWATEAVLDVEVCTTDIIDPCIGLAAMAEVAIERGYRVHGHDIHDWLGKHSVGDVVNGRDGFNRYRLASYRIGNFLETSEPPFDDQFTVLMNPPFSLAADFVSHSLKLGARKVICFQRQAWRESDARRAWWEENPPSRVWVCGARATCWRFDLLDCHHEGGTAACPNFKRKGKKHDTPGCRHCMAGVPTSHAWYVWERGHKGAEVTSAIYPKET